MNEKKSNSKIIIGSSGRPALYGKPMKQTAIYLPEYMINWLNAQPSTISETIRKLIQKEIDHINT